MAWYPLANVMHHKLASALSALGIGIGVCMMITLTGLTRGSLFEVAERWESVEADLIVYPKLKQDVSMLTGAGVADRYAELLPQEVPQVERATAVFLWRMKLAGQDQTVAGVTNDDLALLTGGAKAIAGRGRFEPTRSWRSFLHDLDVRQRAAWIARHGNDDDYLLDPTGDDLAAGGWLELVIDDRLARAGKLSVGQQVAAAGHVWTIVGIVRAGGFSRVYMPRETAQYLFGSGAARSTVLFVKLDDGARIAEAQARVAELTGQHVAPLDSYRSMLLSQFGVMFVYVDVVNLIALSVALLFIMVTLYTMVLQRTRDIAILKSSGASNAFIVRQVLAESLILTLSGAVLGAGLSLVAAWAIERARPLLTVTITGQWIAAGLGAAAVGAAVSALYPAWRAARVDMLAALSYE